MQGLVTPLELVYRLLLAAACSQTCQSQQGECGGGGLGNGGSNLVVVQHAQSNIGELLIASIGPKTNGGRGGQGQVAIHVKGKHLIAGSSRGAMM